MDWRVGCFSITKPIQIAVSLPLSLRFHLTLSESVSVHGKKRLIIFRYTVCTGDHNRWAENLINIIANECSMFGSRLIFSFSRVLWLTCAIAFELIFSFTLDLVHLSLITNLFFRSTSPRCLALDHAIIESKWIDRSIHCWTHEFLSGKDRNRLTFIEINWFLSDLGHRFKRSLFGFASSFGNE